MNVHLFTPDYFRVHQGHKKKDGLEVKGCKLMHICLQPPVCLPIDLTWVYYKMQGKLEHGCHKRSERLPFIQKDPK